MIHERIGRPIRNDTDLNPELTSPSVEADIRKLISIPGTGKKSSSGEPDVDDLVDRLKRCGVHLVVGTTNENFLPRLRTALHALEGKAANRQTFSLGTETEDEQIQRKIAKPGPRTPSIHTR